MSDAEKDALTWLDRMLACSNPGTDAERSVLTLKAMVAEHRIPSAGLKIWVWRDGDHFLAYSHEYPCVSPHGDPCTLGEPAGYAFLLPSFPRAPATKKAVRIRGRNQNGGPVDIILELPFSQTEIEVPL